MCVCVCVCMVLRQSPVVCLLQFSFEYAAIIAATFCWPAPSLLDDDVGSEINFTLGAAYFDIVTGK